LIVRLRRTTRKLFAFICVHSRSFADSFFLTLKHPKQQGYKNSATVFSQQWANQLVQRMAPGQKGYGIGFAVTHALPHQGKALMLAIQAHALLDGRHHVASISTETFGASQDVQHVRITMTGTGRLTAQADARVFTIENSGKTIVGQINRAMGMITAASRVRCFRHSTPWENALQQAL
jgi:hypothetical protein